MRTLVDTIEASRQARERTKVMLETLGRQGSVQAACLRLGIGRTRFQDLRRRLIEGAVGAVEERPAGRPPRARQACPQQQALRRRVSELERELRRTRAELEIARSTAGKAVAVRLAAKGRRR